MCVRPWFRSPLSWLCGYDITYLKCGSLEGNAGEMTDWTKLCHLCSWQDDPPAMDFVTSAANLRMHIFSMNMKSRFDIKCKLFVPELVSSTDPCTISLLTANHSVSLPSSNGGEHHPCYSHH